MNKRGNIFFGVGIAIFLWVMGILILPYITDSVTDSRTGLDCTNISISGGSKITCLYGDVVVPYFIWFLVSLLLGYIAGSFS
jgi:hypothetical protein